MLLEAAWFWEMYSTWRLCAAEWLCGPQDVWFWVYSVWLLPCACVALGDVMLGLCCFGCCAVPAAVVLEGCVVWGSVFLGGSCVTGGCMSLGAVWCLGTVCCWEAMCDWRLHCTCGLCCTWGCSAKICEVLGPCDNILWCVPG